MVKYVCNKLHSSNTNHYTFNHLLTIFITLTEIFETAACCRIDDVAFTEEDIENVVEAFAKKDIKVVVEGHYCYTRLLKKILIWIIGKKI